MPVTSIGVGELRIFGVRQFRALSRTAKDFMFSCSTSGFDGGEINTRNSVVIHKYTAEAGNADITPPAAELKTLAWIDIIGDFGGTAATSAPILINPLTTLDLDPPGAGGANAAFAVDRTLILGDPVLEYDGSTYTNIGTVASIYPIEKTFNAFTAWNSDFPTLYQLNYASWDITWYAARTGYTNWTTPTDISLDWKGGGNT